MSVNQRTLDCGNYIQQMKNQAILMANYNGEGGSGATKHNKTKRINKHQKSTKASLSISKARAHMPGGFNVIH